MNVELFMGKARESIIRLSKGQEFVVKDLFEGHEWNSLSAEDRRGFGMRFKNAVKSGMFADIEFVGRKQNNSSYYRKK